MLNLKSWLSVLYSIVILLLVGFLFFSKKDTIIIFDIIQTKYSVEDNMWLKWETNNFNIVDTKQFIWKAVILQDNNFISSAHLFKNSINFYKAKIWNYYYDIKINKIHKKNDIVYWELIKFSSEWKIIIWNSNLNTNNIYVIKNWVKIYWKILDKNIWIKEVWLNNLIKTNIKLKKWDSWTPLFNEKNQIIWIYQVIDNSYSYASIL